VEHIVIVVQYQTKSKQELGTTDRGLKLKMGEKGGVSMIDGRDDLDSRGVCESITKGVVTECRQMPGFALLQVQEGAVGGSQVGRRKERRLGQTSRKQRRIVWDRRVPCTL